jgi:integrase
MKRSSNAPPIQWIPGSLNSKKIISSPEQLTFHGLRHTNITLLLDSNVPLGEVSSNAGHAKRSTTVDVYYGSIPGRAVSENIFFWVIK